MSALASVLGVGASTPFGLDARQTAMFIRAGKLVPRRTFLGARPEAQVGSARAHRLVDDVLAAERILDFASTALRESARDAALAPDKPVPALVALPEMGRKLSGEQHKWLGASAFLFELERRSGQRLDHSSSDVVRIGHAGFGVALERALSLVARGPVLVGGADSYHDAETLGGLVDDKRLLGETIHNGFVPSEGAAFLSLGPVKVDRPVHARVLAVACGLEPKPDGEDPRTAELSTELVRRVGATFAKRPVGWALPDVNGERHRVKEWTFTTIRNRDVVEIPKTHEQHLYDDAGDLGAATGAVYAMYAVMGFRTGFAPASEALVSLASDGDERAVFALEAAT